MGSGLFGVAPSGCAMSCISNPPLAARRGLFLALDLIKLQRLERMFRGEETARAGDLAVVVADSKAFGEQGNTRCTRKRTVVRHRA